MFFKQMQKNLFLAALLVVSLVFLWLIKSYLLAIFWAAVLAILFYPVKKFFLRIMPRREVVSTLLTMMVMLVIVFVPLYVLGLSVAYETVGVYREVSVGNFDVISSVESLNEKIPVINWLENLGVNKEEINTKASDFLKSFGGYVASGVKSFGQQTLRFVLHFFIMLYVLFFFLLHGKKTLKKLQHLIPLGDKKEERLYLRFTSTVRATVKGTLIIAIIQGCLGAVLFWLVGIPSPILWGVIMAVLGIIPAVGGFIIWAPAGIILILNGSLWQGVTVLVVGALVISSIDNILRPPLVGKDTAMPDVLVLLSTLGGLTIFGVSGFVIGPVIAAFFLSMWSMFEEEYKRELNSSG